MFMPRDDRHSSIPDMQYWFISQSAVDTVQSLWLLTAFVQNIPPDILDRNVLDGNSIGQV